MKDYPYKMTVEQARAFGEDVLNIVAQIPWSCDDVRAYRGLGGMAESFADGGKDIAIFAWSREVAMSSSGKQRGSHGTWLEWTACVIGERGCIFQA